MSKLEEKKKVKKEKLELSEHGTLPTKEILTVVAVGDPHFQTTNIPEVNMFIDRLENMCKEVKPDLIVILGDLLHTHERLHVIPYNKALEFVSKMRNITETIVLVGNHDMCFAQDTIVAMWDGTEKYSQDIEVGDEVMGDDGTPRKVLNLTRGEAKMYDILQLGADSYTVTKNHILCLKILFPTEIYWNVIENLWTVEWLTSEFVIKSKNFSITDNMTKEEVKIIAEKFLETVPIIGIDKINISVCDFLKLPEKIKNKLFGYSNTYEFFIKVLPSKETEFYGWETDGNHMFLLSDGTVVHNCNNQQFLTTDHWMNPMKEWNGVKIVDTVYHRDIKGYHLVFCPYVYPGRFQEALDTDLREWKGADCIFAHQEFYGCKMGAIVSVDGDKWSDCFPPVISGHIHSKQNIEKNVYYCGSSMQHAFGESEKNVIPVIRFNGHGSSIQQRGYSLEEVDLELPRKRIIYTDVHSIEDLKIPEVSDDGSHDKVKITISGVYDEFKAFKKTKKYRELVKTGTKVVFKPKKITKEEQESSPEVNETDFSKILNALVLNEKNSFLYKTYELVVNSKTITDTDILFM
jgi:DNA repair exonuclease SbcCD nuclease subunit